MEQKGGNGESCRLIRSFRDGRWLNRTVVHHWVEKWNGFPKGNYSPTQHKYVVASKVTSVRNLGIRFPLARSSLKVEDPRCLYCDEIFEEKRALNIHYFQAHSSAFSSEELLMAAARRAPQRSAPH
jgi:hypothetical protein